MDDGRDEELSLISQIMFLQHGEVDPENASKMIRLEKQVVDWKRDVVDKQTANASTEEHTFNSMAAAVWELLNDGDGYWCQGKTCECERSHWVRFEQENYCYECQHEPCACHAPLVWDEGEDAYYRINKRSPKYNKKVWMSQPKTVPVVKRWWKEQKQISDDDDRHQELRECEENQREAQNHGYCCYSHAVQRKEEEKKENTKKKARMIDGPDHCISCDDDPCAFLQIEVKICENDDIYFVTEDYNANKVEYNDIRRERAFKYAAYILWNKKGFNGAHYKCVETGVESLFPIGDEIMTSSKKK
jgi:hypothetical protein